jgi:two-component system, OmpR family, response regulator
VGVYTESTRVLIVEDEPELRWCLLKCLEPNGFSTVCVASAAEMYQALADGGFSVAIVDIGLPDQSGLVLVEYLRKNTDMGVIILTGMDTEEDRVRGYSSGADLFLAKPFNWRELVAAIKSIAGRRFKPYSQPMTPAASGKWLLDKSSWQLTAPGGAAISVTAQELRFIEILATCGGVVPREKVLTMLYNRHDEHTSRALNALVRRLRAKIEEVGARSPIKTARTVGYSFASAVIMK